MTASNHDAFRDLSSGTPAPFSLAARSLPVVLGLQFLLAGQALYGGIGWGAHATVGGLVSLPVLALAGYAVLVPWLRGFAWWAGALLVLYLGQVALAANGGAALALHPFNAALLLTASLVLLFKVERRNARCRDTKAS
ncbi:hypothetical protein Salmuc_01859 [Salipiger mucosus DSM 16094]|uniref:Uncharacterized protein n=2 Tax=Salipiger mucosus TaxID=263378 RepID=S9SCY3_9RHOB|nr:hypothetical protein Salmuc_01859 [Salipiger mucosus DSM 16094]